MPDEAVAQVNSTKAIFCPIHGEVEIFKGPNWRTPCQMCYIMQGWASRILDNVEEKGIYFAREMVRQGPVFHKFGEPICLIHK